MLEPNQKLSHGRRLVVSPQEPLVAGGPAEELEQRIQELYRRGYGHVVIDLRGVPSSDSAGMRALVRGHTTAQRLHRRFTIVQPTAKVRELLKFSLLDRVLEIADSMDALHTKQVSWDRILVATGVGLVGLTMVVVGIMWPLQGETSSIPPELQGSESTFDLLRHPLLELAKLVAAAIIGMLVTAVHRNYRAERAPNPMLDQAQVLLCVAGALMMIIIGSSLARAFGIAGAASIIRFRTPVEDARDITILFILMGLGMAAGLGAFAVAGLGTLFLCALIPVLSLFSSERPRTMLVEIAADGREFPVTHVMQVFAVNGVVFEPREVSQGDEATVRYLATLKSTDSIEDISAQLMGDGKLGIKNVSWSPPKRA